MANKSTVFLTAVSILLIVYVSLFSLLQHSGKKRDKSIETQEIRYMDSVDSIIKNDLHSHQLKTRELSLRNLREMRNIIQQEEDHKEILPIIHAITPTYKRFNQIPELTRVSNTLKNVKSLHWIVIEDGNKTLPEVKYLLLKSGINFTYINAKPYRNVSKSLKGIHQRNKGIFWLQKNVDLSKDGVVYFADDDNTYDLELFDQMRHTKKVSVWPVGFVSRRKYQTPIIKNGKVVKFNSWNTEYRKFPIDMAGFALNTKLFHYNPHLYFWKTVPIGYQETRFLELCCSVKDLEPKADGCTKVLVWHTKAKDPIIEYASYNDTESVSTGIHEKDKKKIKTSNKE